MKKGKRLDLVTIRLLKAQAEEGMTAKELSDKYDIPTPTVKYHIVEEERARQILKSRASRTEFNNNQTETNFRNMCAHLTKLLDTMENQAAQEYNKKLREIKRAREAFSNF